MESFGDLSLNLFIPKPAGAVCKLFSSLSPKISSVDEISIWSGVSGFRKTNPSHFASSMTLMNGPHSSGYIGVACLLLQCCLTARSLGPKLSKGAGLFQELFWSLTTHWFQYHEITLPPVRGEDGKVVRNKAGTKKIQNQKKLMKFNQESIPARGFSPRVSLQLQSAISTSVSSLPNLEVFSPLADPY